MLDKHKLTLKNHMRLSHKAVNSGIECRYNSELTGCVVGGGGRGVDVALLSFSFEFLPFPRILTGFTQNTYFDLTTALTKRINVQLFP
jgi:hypothetical protein